MSLNVIRIIVVAILLFCYINQFCYKTTSQHVCVVIPHFLSLWNWHFYRNWLDGEHFPFQTTKAGFIFVRTIFCPKRKCSPLLKLTPKLLTNATTRHEYFRGLSRLLPVPGVLVSFLELRFPVKMALLGFERAPLASQKALSKSKGTF